MIDKPTFLMLFLYHVLVGYDCLAWWQRLSPSQYASIWLWLCRMMVPIAAEQWDCAYPAARTCSHQPSSTRQAGPCALGSVTHFVQHSWTVCTLWVDATDLISFRSCSSKLTSEKSNVRRRHQQQRFIAQQVQSADVAAGCRMWRGAMTQLHGCNS